MLIAQSAVDDFLDRRLDDFTWVKELGHRDLMREIEAIAPDFEFKTVPWTHQAACVLIGLCVPNFLFLLDMSAGKTKVLLDVFAIRKHLGEAKRALVLADTVTSVYSWQEQVQEHSDLTAVVLDGTSEERLSLLLEDDDADVFIVTYVGLLHMVCDRRVSKKKGDGSKEMSPNATKIKKVANRFDTMLPDEIHTCKNRQSLSFRVLNKIGKTCAYRYGTTGTPSGRNVADLWAQFFLIDRGETLGPTLGLFRAAFFEERQGFAGYSEYVFAEDMMGDLKRVMQHRSLSYSEEELGGMPRKHEVRVPIPMTDGVHSYYSMVRKGMVKLFKQGSGAWHKKEIKNAFIRMRQVVSGFIGLDFEGKKTKATFGSYKTEWLDNEIDKMLASDGKLIVFHEFIPSGRLVEEVLKRHRIKYVTLNGATKDKRAAQHAFLNDRSVRVCIANYKSGSTAWNPQKVTNRLVFFELPVSPITFTQAFKRVYRRKGHKRVYVWYLITKDSVEEDVIEMLKEGRDVMDAITNKDIKVV